MLPSREMRVVLSIIAVIPTVMLALRISTTRIRSSFMQIVRSSVERRSPMTINSSMKIMKSSVSVAPRTVEVE